MAVAVAIATGGGQYDAKLTLLVLLSCMVAAMGGLIFGYDIGVSGGVSAMPSFLKKFFPKVFMNMIMDANISNYCRFDSQLLTAFTSSLYFAGLVTSFFASWVTRDFGRKPSTLIGGVSFLIGATLNGAASNISMLIIGRILLGVGVGFTNQSVPLYLSEMAPPSYRGALNAGFQLCTGIGVFAANLINYGTTKITAGWGWRVSLALAAVPALILTVGAIFLPETPNSIIQRTNDHEKTRAMLQRIRGTTEVQAELDDLVQASLASKLVENSFKNIIQRKYRPQLVITVAVSFFTIMTGINMIGFYFPILLMTIGLSLSSALITSAMLIGIVGTATTMIAMTLIDKLGRRLMLMSGGVAMVLSFSIVGAILAAHLHDHGDISKRYAYLVVVMMCIFMASFSWSWGPIAWLVPSEILPLEIRSAGQSIAVAVQFLATSIIAQTFLAMFCHFKFGIFFFFGGWTVLMTAFVYFMLPETKNIPIEKMDAIWRDHWYWKKFVDSADEKSKIEAA